jgi:hypothetical protein
MALKVVSFFWLAGNEPRACRSEIRRISSSGNTERISQGQANCIAARS